jgi:hypothetical protein
MHFRDTATPGKSQLVFSVAGLCCVQVGVSWRGLSLLLMTAALAAASCGRSPLLLPPDLVADAAVPADTAADRPADLASDPKPERADAPPDPKPDRAVDAPAETGPPPCKPQPETCNGVDDDCNGALDENQPPIPCPGGGSRYCIAGRYSECPRRCDVCVPGSQRICMISFCLYWGHQTCAADGRSFSACRELAPPPECDQIAKGGKSAALEQCCLDNDYCCLDEFDLDHDGDKTKMLGRCEAVVCGP